MEVKEKSLNLNIDLFPFTTKSFSSNRELDKGFRHVIT